MASPAFLLRLMQHAGLSSALARRLGPEDRMACQFAADLRKATLEGRLRAVWTHPANELVGAATGPTAAIARALGLHRGVSDYLFMWGGGNLALEAKSARGRLSDHQSDFERWCFLNNVPFIVFRTVEEGCDTLKNFGILTDG